MHSRWSQAIAVVAVAVAAAAAVAVAGLAFGGRDGGGTSSLGAYEATVVNARDRLDFALAGISRAQSLEELLAQLNEAADTADATAADLDTAGVAEGFEDENDRLVDALRAFASELSGTAATLGDPTFAEALPHMRSLSFKQFVVVNRIFADMDRQGVEVDPLSRH